MRVRVRPVARVPSGFAALGAAQQAGEVVVGAGRGAVGGGLASGGEHGLGLCPHLGGDQGRVGVGDGVVAETELAEVDAVGQGSDDLVGRPGAAGGGRGLVS